MKKFLTIGGLYFLLPDDFNGNLTEALEALVEYRKSEEAKERRHIGEPGEGISRELEDAMHIVHRESYNAFQKHNGRISGFDFSINIYDENTGEWDQMENIDYN